MTSKTVGCRDLTVRFARVGADSEKPDLLCHYNSLHGYHLKSF